MNKKFNTSTRSSDKQHYLDNLIFDEQTAIQVLDKLRSDSNFPSAWIAANLKALYTNNFEPLESMFIQEKFLDKKGKFIIIAPYNTFRNNQEEVYLTGMIGQALPHKRLGQKVYNQIKKLITPAQELIPHVIPISVISSFGAAAPNTGEGFMVPTGWAWSTGANGPALNNMTEQSRRIDMAGKSALERIFVRESFNLLIKPFLTSHKGHWIRNLEYSLHDAGHITGYRGLFYKLSRNLLISHWTKGFEEYRADGVGLQIATELYPVPVTGQIIASNIVTRFGMDAHRAGGIGRDFDTVVSLIMFDRLWRSRAIRIEGGKLSFVNPTLKGLIQATEWQRRDSIVMSRAELQMSDERELPSLYQEFCQITDNSRVLFERYILEPCRGLYPNLR